MTAAPGGKSNCGASVNRSVDSLEIERRRRELNVSLSTLLSSAGVSARTWDYIRAGHVTPQQRTLIKLCRALDRIEAGAGAAVEEPRPTVVDAFWRMAVAFFARELGAEPGRALDDLGQSCPQDPAWLAASRARQLAFYVTHTELSVSLSALAAAVGTSKQRVHKAVNRVEDLRDVVDLDALLDRASAYLTRRPVPATTGTFGKGMVP